MRLRSPALPDVRPGIPPAARAFRMMASPSAGCFRTSLRYRASSSSASLCVVVTTTVSLLGPWVLKYAIDDLQRSASRERKLAPLRAAGCSASRSSAAISAF